MGGTDPISVWLLVSALIGLVISVSEYWLLVTLSFNLARFFCVVVAEGFIHWGASLSAIEFEESPRVVAMQELLYSLFLLKHSNSY